jgi:YegS/Rv2252/BmrU family lipid kinase
MKTMVILNPVAGKGKVQKVHQIIKKELEKRGITADYNFSHQPGGIKRWASECVKRGYERVIICGGDGTVHEAIPGLVNAEVALGIIPLGTGNDLSRTLGIKKDISFACSVIEKGQEKMIDVARVNGDQYFAGVGALGFDAEVAALAEQFKRFVPGRGIYLLAILAKLLTYKFKRVKIRFNDEEYQGEVLLVAFGNSRFYGGGIEITPQAEMDDGVLDLCVIKRLPKLKLLFLLPTVFKGSHIHFSEVNLYRARKIKVESNIPLHLYGDGELVSHTPLFIEVIPQALRVIVPSREIA